jgi:hypothetical protein
MPCKGLKRSRNWSYKNLSIYEHVWDNNNKFDLPIEFERRTRYFLSTFG